MPSGPWDDPTIQAYLGEWRSNIQRCVKAVHPGRNVDPFSRKNGLTNAGGIITLNSQLDPIPDTAILTSREDNYTCDPTAQAGVSNLRLPRRYV